MKISPLSFVIGISAIALGGCSLPKYDDSSCAGYLGCSSKNAPIGVAPTIDGGTGTSTLRRINRGCGKELPMNQVPTQAGKPTGYTHYMVMGTGKTLAADVPSKAGPRTFWVRVPQNYDPHHKYRVVYIGQGCGGYLVANTSTLQLFKEATGGTEQAIYVALDIPMDMANMDCYDNRDGPSSQEWEAFQLFQQVVDDNYCVDNDRVYVSGYSTGGWLTNMWGCYFAGDGLHPYNGVVPTTMSIAAGTTGLTSRAGNVTDAGADGAMSMADAAGHDAAMSMPTDGPAAPVDGAMGDGGGVAMDGGDMTVTGARKFAPEYHIRGQLGVSGGEPDNDPPCNGPLGAIWIHDLMDSNPYTANHEIALNRVMKMNGCFSKTPKTAPWHEEIMGTGVCVKYTDCPAAYPVVFCTTKMEGHGAQAEKAIPGFKVFLDELEVSMTGLVKP